MTLMSDAIDQVNERAHAMSGGSREGGALLLQGDCRTPADVERWMREKVGQHLSGVVLDPADVDYCFRTTAAAARDLHELSHTGADCLTQIATVHGCLVELLAAGVIYERKRVSSAHGRA
jgi:hypothetical protein